MNGVEIPGGVGVLRQNIVVWQMSRFFIILYQYFSTLFKIYPVQILAQVMW